MIFDNLNKFTISIHAPRVGSDYLDYPLGGGDEYFNPRSPCGERLVVATRMDGSTEHFNPRSPCGERPAVVLLLM